MRLIIGFIILSFVSFSCNSNDSKSTKKTKPSNNPTPTSQLKPVKNDKPLIKIEQLLSNEGYINIPLNIVGQTNKDGYLVNKIQAMSKNDTLELIVSLKEGISGNNILVDGIIFESTGHKSDRLLTALAQKYKINSNVLTMQSKQVFACANLNKAPVNYQSGTPKFKIFLNGKGEVAELYINFDFEKSTISLNEKDPQYRNALINLLKE